MMRSATHLRNAYTAALRKLSSSPRYTIRKTGTQTTNGIEGKRAFNERVVKKGVIRQHPFLILGVLASTPLALPETREALQEASKKAIGRVEILKDLPRKIKTDTYRRILGRIKENSIFLELETVEQIKENPALVKLTIEEAAHRIESTDISVLLRLFELAPEFTAITFTPHIAHTSLARLDPRVLWRTILNNSNDAANLFAEPAAKQLIHADKEWLENREETYVTILDYNPNAAESFIKAMAKNLPNIPLSVLKKAIELNPEQAQDSLPIAAALNQEKIGTEIAEIIQALAPETAEGMFDQWNIKKIYEKDDEEKTTAIPVSPTENREQLTTPATEDPQELNNSDLINSEETLKEKAGEETSSSEISEPKISEEHKSDDDRDE